MSALDSTPSTDLSDVREAKEEWARALVRERGARTVLGLSVEVARENGATLADIATELGCSRQYVHKMLRDVRVEAEQSAYLATRYNPENARRSLGRTGGYDRPQCGGCKRFLKSRGAQCPSCGYLEGGGYFAVPAQTSHLERFR